MWDCVIVALFCLMMLGRVSVVVSIKHNVKRQLFQSGIGRKNTSLSLSLSSVPCIHSDQQSDMNYYNIGTHVLCVCVYEWVGRGSGMLPGIVNSLIQNIKTYFVVTKNVKWMSFLGWLCFRKMKDFLLELISENQEPNICDIGKTRSLLVLLNGSKPVAFKFKMEGQTANFEWKMKYVYVFFLWRNVSLFRFFNNNNNFFFHLMPYQLNGYIINPHFPTQLTRGEHNKLDIRTQKSTQCCTEHWTAFSLFFYAMTFIHMNDERWTMNVRPL